MAHGDDVGVAADSVDGVAHGCSPLAVELELASEKPRVLPPAGGLKGEPVGGGLEEEEVQLLVGTASLVLETGLAIMSSAVAIR